ncbi:MAG: hypothetical protein A2W98_06030 [Bacteroidetes bacterium GWF2_33_38]|nr:MAG: hypothetical protein A2W98_06030 [Bacteroidetes bacterium GWF2_33_38]OFY90039.1 MAG: hypothetical protein A2236_06295 [Bacteroidetes bacterium RIFOXYA2_FULL_33_7]HBX49582.1 hypothetical protein [Bacteroidales bacterium]
MKYFSVFILVIVCFISVSAQQILTLDSAISIALKNNYSILISKNESEISKNDATIGNAGMLPQLSLNASGTFADNNTKQEFSTGTVVSETGAISTGLNAGAALSWTIFDGFKMFISYDKLREISNMSEISLKLEIENTIEKICTEYFQIVKQKQLLKAIEQNLELYDERVKIAETKWKIGSGSKLDYLQAKVDMNSQTSNYLTQKNAMKELKISLNNLLANNPENELDVEDSISIIYSPLYEELKTSVQTQNVQLLLQQKNIEIEKYSLRELQSQAYPKLILNGAYNFSRTDNQVGMILYNRNLGPSAGLTLSWNIFSGNVLKQQVANSKILIENSELLFNETKSFVESSLLKAFNDFNNAKQILELEEENIMFAKENIDVALESFRLGSSNAIELKEAQKSYEDAQSRLVNARYATKLAEIRLMKLNGMLVK